MDSRKMMMMAIGTSQRAYDIQDDESPAAVLSHDVWEFPDTSQSYGTASRG